MILHFLWAILALALFIYGLRPAQRWRFRRIPGPSPAWLLGNLGEVVKKGKHEAFRQWGKMYGGVYKIMEGGIVSIVINDPQLGR
jgi:hypothetical protein